MDRILLRQLRPNGSDCRTRTGHGFTDAFMPVQRGVVMMRMASNKKVMGPFTRVSKVLRVVGWLATAVMAVAAVALLVTTFKQ